MRKWLAVLALAWAWPAAAQASAEALDFRAMSDADLQARSQETRTAGFGDACRSKVPLFAELLRRNPGHAEYKVRQTVSAIFCADEEGRPADALGLLKQAEREALGRPIDILGLSLAVRLEDAAEALARLRSMAQVGELRDIPVDLTFASIRTVRRDDLDDEFEEFAYELTKSSRFGQLDPDLQQAFAFGAVGHAVRIGDLPRVDGLLEHISNAQSYLSMLSLRDYEAAWPQIAERAGDNLTRAAEADVRRTAERLAAEPENRDRLSSYAHALLFAGRFQEAIDVARSWRPQRDSLQDLQEGDAWSLNIEAYALDALGRRAEADTVFNQLAALPADEHPWVVNFVINRASRLVGQERWEEGLHATELARMVAEKHGSTYAKLIIARDRACALQRLGRSEEANREAEFLIEEFNEWPPNAAPGLMCLGRQAEAERLIAKAMIEESPRDRLLSDLQDDRFELFYTPSALPRARELVLANAALREVALERIRLLPEQFVPISYLRRTQVAQGRQ
jgi:Flp pilus assembly protein TadD